MWTKYWGVCGNVWVGLSDVCVCMLVIVVSEGGCVCVSDSCSTQTFEIQHSTTLHIISLHIFLGVIDWLIDWIVLVNRIWIMIRCIWIVSHCWKIRPCYWIHVAWWQTLSSTVLLLTLYLLPSLSLFHILHFHISSHVLFHWVILMVTMCLFCSRDWLYLGFFDLLMLLIFLIFLCFAAE